MNKLLDQVFCYGLIGLFIVLAVFLIVLVFKFILFFLSAALIVALAVWLYVKLKE